MVDFGVTPTITSVLAMKFARMATKRERRSSTVSNGALNVINVTVRLLLHVAGFGLLTMAGFTFSMLAGLIVAGVSCFAMAKLMLPENPDENPLEVRRAPDLRTGR